MKKKILIGAKEVGMTANAATPYFFNQVFREDFFKIAASFEDDGGVSVDAFSKVGFIMASQCKYKDDMSAICELTEKDYVEWLTGFATMDIVNAIPEIAELYTAQTEPKSKPKK